MLETGIKERIDGYCAWFRIDNQTFHLDTVETKEQAEWYLQCLNTAFEKFGDAVSDIVSASCGVYARKDLNPDFLKITDQIQENLKRKE